MNLQLNCPYCQQLISADASLAGSQLQCPTCHQLFMIAANVAPVIPVVQARAAPSAQRPPAAGAQPSRKPAGALPRTPQTAAEKRAAAEKEESKAKLAMVAIVIGGVGLIVGGIWLVSALADKSRTDIAALPPEVVKREQAAKAEREKQKKEEDALRSKDKAEFRDLLRTRVCEGNDKVAGELTAVVEKIESEYDALMQDADMNNDPKDVRAFWKDRLQKHSDESPVIRNWLGGKSSNTIMTAIFGPEPTKPRGDLPMFLVTGGYSGNGTGFCISPDGWLITNEHVVGDSETVDARGADGKVISARVIEKDSKVDLALLKIAEKPVAWLHVEPVAMQRGARVFTVGFPNATVQGVEPKFTDGRVSSTAGIRDDAETYQTSVPVGPGNSGGALVNLENGSVAGVVSSKLNARLAADSVSYAIKSSVLEAMLKSVAEANGAGIGEASGHPANETETIDQVTKATYLILTK